MFEVDKTEKLAFHLTIHISRPQIILAICVIDDLGSRFLGICVHFFANPKHHQLGGTFILRLLTFDRFAGTRRGDGITNS